jgi:hypothetical protein
LDVLFHQLGQDLVLPGQLLFQRGDLLVLRVRRRGPGSGTFERGRPVLEERLLPQVELRDGDPRFLAHLGDRVALQHVFPQDSDLGRRGKMPTLGHAHDEPPEWKCRHQAGHRPIPFSTEAEQ